MRISELAEQAGVPTTTVRFYERIGLLESPPRTHSGYRDYDENSATRLRFVHRARRIGLSCEQIAELLPVWGGADCSAAHDRVLRLLDEKQAEITRRIDELEEFSRQLRDAQATLLATPPPESCRTDLSCCVPSDKVEAVSLELVTRRKVGPAGH
jgi:DNA-binding transcriptional MerR regulator